MVNVNRIVEEIKANGPSLDDKKMRDYGTLTLDHGELRYEKGDKDSPSSWLQNWAIPLDQVAVVAEYTTDEGPFLEDYFAAFVTRDGEPYVVPHGAMTEAFMAAITSSLAFAMTYPLVWSTTWASSIIWPKELAGKELWVTTPVRPSSLIGRIAWFIGIKRFSTELSPEVLRYLER